MEHSAIVIGAGGIGGFHLEKLVLLQQMGKIDRIAFSRTTNDNVQESYSRLKKQFPGVQVKGFTCVEQLVSEEQAEFAIISTPTTLHNKHATYLLENDNNLKGVLLEKPSTTGQYLSKELITIAQEKNVCYGINLQLASIHLPSSQEHFRAALGISLEELMAEMTCFKCVWESTGSDDVLMDLGTHALSLIDFRQFKHYQVIKTEFRQDYAHFTLEFPRYIAEFQLAYRKERQDCRRSFAVTMGKDYEFFFGGVKENGCFLPSLRCRTLDTNKTIIFPEDFCLTSIQKTISGQPLVPGDQELTYLEALNEIKNVGT